MCGYLHLFDSHEAVLGRVTVVVCLCLCMCATKAEVSHCCFSLSTFVSSLLPCTFYSVTPPDSYPALLKLPFGTLVSVRTVEGTEVTPVLIVSF